MYRRLTTTLSLLFVLVLLVSACAPAAAPSAPAAPAAGEEAAAPEGEEQIELRIAWWGSQDRHDRTIKVIEMFEELHPNIDIVYEFGGFNDHLTKMSTQAAGGNLPDIMQLVFAWIGVWSARGLLMPLDDFIADGTLDFSNVSDSELAGGRIDGKLYAVNLGTNSQAITIDLDAFEQAGIEAPRPDWTWEEFEQ
ncbi:MAG: extracellular solute-binding protein, partial [Chloroflexota bacterium]|nr:extracellular solute-binding protein [Chloroflexota bacterium]